MLTWSLLCLHIPSPAPPLFITTRPHPPTPLARPQGIQASGARLGNSSAGASEVMLARATALTQSARRHPADAKARVVCRDVASICVEAGPACRCEEWGACVPSQHSLSDRDLDPQPPSPSTQRCTAAHFTPRGSKRNTRCPLNTTTSKGEYIQGRAGASTEAWPYRNDNAPHRHWERRVSWEGGHCGPRLS